MNTFDVRPLPCLSSWIMREKAWIDAVVKLLQQARKAGQTVWLGTR